MSTVKSDFVYSSNPEPHRSRTRQILKEHPEMRQLIGKNPASFWFIMSLVLLQVTMAWMLSTGPWWALFVVAYIVGAFADHSLFVLIHECAHHLIFKTKAANRWAGMLANTVSIFPTSVSFERYHIKHHSFQGIHELDGDLPNRWEAKLINNYFIGKVIWLLFYPIWQTLRLSRMKEIKPFDKWAFFNVAVQVVFSFAILFLFGWKAVIYLIVSFFFSVGLHPLGARWIQEHFLTHNDHQETYSYYGPANAIAFNVGYHNEHHDFPSIPWNKLPRIKSTAPRYYDSLVSHQSWTRLFLRFLFDSELSLFSRIVRKDRGKVKLTDTSIPDQDLLASESPGQGSKSGKRSMNPVSV